MTQLSPSANKSTVAILFIGNIGAGKSTLLAQIGGSFPSGVKFMEGYTKDISEQVVTLDGKLAILMDTPGLYEIDDEVTEANAKKLTEALRKGYNYKLFFVLTANNRGLTREDLALMSKVNACARQVDGAKIDFRVIINQIKDDDTYNMYEEGVAKDNFRMLFGTLKVKGFSFDIQVNGVILIRFDKGALERKSFATVISEQIKAQKHVKVKLLKDILAKNKDLSAFGKVFGIVAALLATTAVIAFELYMGGTQSFALKTTDPAKSDFRVQGAENVKPFLNCLESFGVLELDTARLKVPKVKIFYLHAPDFFTPFEVTLKAVDEMYRDGLFDEFGLSNFAAWQVALIHQICHFKGYIKPTVYQGWAGGFLTGNYHMDSVVKDGTRFDTKTVLGEYYRSQYWSPLFFDAVDALKAVSSAHGIPLLEASIRWMNHHSGLGPKDGLIFGANDRVEDLRENIINLQQGPLPKDLVKAFEDTWEKVKAANHSYFRRDTRYLDPSNGFKESKEKDVNAARN
ncbi:hypothetical protein BGZ65_002026 [Modicella reniformis]|uniref:Uncharacterized protein n=1 Tax=Modicella reniformis TaxID=1440133 RepID=A0A9P6LT14_9FUNG|nr:hypothetical protein BGZ65_002026 [Modicella reniformis]